MGNNCPMTAQTNSDCEIITAVQEREDGSSNRRPQVSVVMCSEGVRGYFRQFKGRTG